MRRLPAIRNLTSAVMSDRVGKQPVSVSVDFLLRNRADLEYFQDLEDFIFASGPPHRPAFEYHFTALRRSLAKTLWSREIFIGASVLDALLFQAVAHTLSTNPVSWVLQYIRDQGLHGPGLVIYPLHSFGILGAGLFRWFTGARPLFVSPRWGLALSPQSNDWDGTYRFLDHLRQTFGISRMLPRELLEHWSRSRPIRWFTQNPLLVARTRSFPGDYYENQSLLVLKLQFLTSFCFMLASLQPNLKDRQERIKAFGSSFVNNFQTLDIRHYLVLYPNIGTRKNLTGQCIPIHGRPGALSELSDLAVEFNPQYWRRQHRGADRICQSLHLIEAGFLRCSLGSLGSKRC